MVSGDIGSCIRDIRQKEGLTAAELSSIIGIDPTNLTKIETGRIKNPGFDSIIKIVEILSNTETILKKKINLLEYGEDVARLFMVFSKQHDVNEEYKKNVLNEKLRYFVDNLQYITTDELNMINTFSMLKKQRVESAQVVSSFIEGITALVEKRLLDNIYEVDFFEMLREIIQKADEPTKSYINTLFREVILEKDFNKSLDFFNKLMECLIWKENLELYSRLLEKVSTVWDEVTYNQKNQGYVEIE